MKRQIKFRAWDKVYKHFHEGDIVSDYNLGEFINDEEYEVTQFTGLVDHIDVDIYEGDVISYASKLKEKEPFNCVVVFDSKHGCYKYCPVSLYEANAGNGGWTGFEHSMAKSVEVVGNIFENSSLLNESEAN